MFRCRQGEKRSSRANGKTQEEVFHVQLCARWIICKEVARQSPSVNGHPSCVTVPTWLPSQCAPYISAVTTVASGHHSERSWLALHVTKSRGGEGGGGPLVWRVRKFEKTETHVHAQTIGSGTYKQWAQVPCWYHSIERFNWSKRTCNYYCPFH